MISSWDSRLVPRKQFSTEVEKGLSNREVHEALLVSD
jgi:hypothetical protein